MNSITSEGDVNVLMGQLQNLLLNSKGKNPVAEAAAQRLLAQINASNTHVCPGVDGWPIEKQRQFVAEHRQEPGVLWNLRKLMMQAQGQVPETLDRICRFRISSDSATEMVKLCAQHLFAMDTKSPELRLFGAEFAWSVPTPEIITYIQGVTEQGARPVVEIGAGLGYLAREMRAMKVTWYAYDKFAETFPKDKLWTQVLPGGPEKLKEHENPNTILCLCFPPQTGMEGYKMDALCAALFRGKDILYIGDELSENEGEMNSTGSRDFAVILSRLKYKLVKVLPCAQAPHHFDKLFHYQRISQ